MMKILMVVANFVPEIGSAAHVYYDLAKAFVKRGHEVDVLTSYPREYNLHEKDVGTSFPINESLEGINVHRCKHPSNRDNIVVRGFEHFYIPYYYFNHYKKMEKKFDACLMYIPPLPLYYLAKKIKKYDGTPSVLNFQDFHPQELTDVGILKNPLLIKIMEHIERAAYKNADHITVLSEGGVDYVVNRGGDPDKITHIYNGTLVTDIDNYAIKKDFKIKKGIKDKCLISYAGILSPFQKIDDILDVAKLLVDYRDIIFYIVGDGMSKEHLKNRIETEKIYNVELLPFQEREEYFNIINSSDVSLILLDERMKAPCLPGKTINLMASKKPVIAIVNKDTESANIINESQCGCVVEPNNIDYFKNIVLFLKKNKSMQEK
ncbi:glycosyltransferase involved in cell wall biosynthesis [Methanohalophilus euhalobius]|uniref:Glycosyltransferase involved in cell wall biosynthesis n=1 Tax=Methanohalophilus euhalobius TaxID=51203 RepID=A0A285GBG7_9EURY|nr:MULTISPECIES: glycosyltransferase family 4 protein [Methanohalophilus]ODV48842.1 MAG: Glycosyltransferase [Methanohalophilus sp. 2-GBenrich]TCL11591.1 glycosyltransferase involved in cell wall biosynthesis [Methanohalophilus euhalobius]SNY20673.1 Glycosyltransferase involved in cell wall bisynthesis [Methanohalophilus euhalobius]